jgi:predicted transcriptional regulator
MNSTTQSILGLIDNDLIHKEIKLYDWLKLFRHKEFCNLSSFEQQLYILIYIFDEDNKPLSISKIVLSLRKAQSSVRRALKSLETKGIISLKTHLSSEINRELTFVYLVKKF